MYEVDEFYTLSMPLFNVVYLRKKGMGCDIKIAVRQVVKYSLLLPRLETFLKKSLCYFQN